jgi:flagella basal body P-ring formation protein FlgA
MPVDQPAPANDDQAAGTAPQPAPATAPPSQSLQSLRELLKQDLSQRLQIPAENLEMTFNSADDNVLNLVQPYFTFNIYPRQVRTLGDVSWGVDITRDGQTQHALINATARAWQTQAVLERPLDYRQIIQEGDVAEKRMLTDHLSDEPLLARGQAIGMQASRILKPGMVLTGDMVDPPLLAKTGELVTVSVTHGSVRVTAVARALESGSFGETIRVRDESSNPPQVYDVTLTGPQTGTLSAAN